MSRTAGWACLVLALGGLAPGNARADEDAVRACVEHNAPQRSSVMEISLNSRIGGEASSVTRFKLYWRKLANGERRVMLRFLEPPDLANTAVLVEGVREKRPRVHLYLPDFGKPQRLTSRGQLESFLGRAGLGLAEIAVLLDPVGGADLRVLDEGAVVDGRAGWEIELRTAGDEGTRYARTQVFVDRDFCVPLRARFFDGQDRLVRLLLVEPGRVRREAASWIPRELLFRDPHNESETLVRVERVEVDVPLAPSLLTVGAMTRGVH